MSEPVICGMPYEDFIIRVEEFHGYRSPGIILGAKMVETALGELGPTPYLNVVTETVVCLPDAVQLLTPCTMGNGFLQVLDWGKFALTTYDRETLSGVRVWLNFEPMAAYPLIRNWFERSDANRQKPVFEEISKEILAAASDLIDHRPVRLQRALKNTQRIPTGLCPKCGESYPLEHGPACLSCQGHAYYTYWTPIEKLRQVGLVRSERDGYWIPYSIDEDALHNCRDLLTEVCTCGCQGSGNFKERALDDSNLEALKAYEQEIENELNIVRNRIRELEHKNS